MDDEWDELHGEADDLDGGCCEATGHPVVDRSGYQSPTRRVRPDSGFVPSSPGRDWLAQCGGRDGCGRGAAARSGADHRPRQRERRC
jgi:hypothetical protein